MKIKIITDSTADVTKQTRSQFNIVPLTVRFGNEQFLDGIDLDYDSFYTKLETDESFPSTSQANPMVFEQVYQKTLEEYDAAIVITVSSRLSGTYQSAMIAAQEYKNKIFVVDSFNGSIGTGILAKRGLELIDQGLDVQEIVDILNREKEKIVVRGIPTTLEYLKRGGRISSASALAGTVLSIKPILGVIDGKVESIGKARGTKKAYRIMNEEVEKCGGIDYQRPYSLGYTGNDIQPLQQYIEFSQPMWKDVDIARIGTAIGTHLGPGAILVAFFKQ